MRFTFPILSTVKVIDGDSVRLLVDLGFHIARQVDVRIMGVDAPEMHGEHKEEAVFVRSRVDDFMRMHAGTSVLISHGLDKYGRVLGDIHTRLDDGNVDTHASLGTMLIEEGMARLYTGNKKHEWTASELLPIREAIARQSR